MSMRDNVEKMVRWLELDSDLRRATKISSSRKAWLTKEMGISGANQTKGAIKALRFLLEGWE